MIINFKIFENVSSQNDIELLSDIILKSIVNRTLEFKNWKNYPKIDNKYLLVDSILPIVLNQLNIKNQKFDKKFKEFIIDKTWFRVVIEERNSPRGDYTITKNGRNPQINLYYTEKMFDDFYREIDNNLDNINFWNLYDFLKKRQTTLQHEIQHAFDDWRSKGKSFKNIVSSDDDYEKYVKQPHEISAQFTATVSTIKDYKSSNWLHFLSKFKTTFPNWNNQETVVKKRLLSRLYVIWNNSFNNEEDFNNDISTQISDLEKKLRNEYNTKDIRFYYNDDTNCIFIKEIKVDTIEQEKEIYKNIMWYADIYRKTIAVDLIKNYTTKSISYGKEYLKLFGFIKNTKPKRDYKFMEGYIRYTKRKSKKQ